MRVLLFGATGMVGQGVLRECLLASDVTEVVTIGRSPVGQQHPKLREIVRSELSAYTGVPLSGFTACFFTLGVSVAGLSEEQYRRITFELTMAAARELARVSPEITFIYVSGAGAGGRAMWARVKGETEKALLELLPNAYMFRPAMIQPMHGIQSKTKLYSVFYAITKPLLPLLRRFPSFMTTTEQVGRAMLAVARHGAPKRVLESADINRLG